MHQKISRVKILTQWQYHQLVQTMGQGTIALPTLCQSLHWLCEGFMILIRLAQKRLTMQTVPLVCDAHQIDLGIHERYVLVNFDTAFCTMGCKQWTLNIFIISLLGHICLVFIFNSFIAWKEEMYSIYVILICIYSNNCSLCFYSVTLLMLIQLFI